MPDLLPRLVEHLRDALQSQIVGGGLVLMLAGALMALCRRVPASIGAFLRRQIVVSVEVLNADASFVALARWLDRHPHTRQCRRLTVATVYRGSHPTVIFTPAPGVHWLWHAGRPLLIARERKENAGGSFGDRPTTVESFTLLTLGRRADVIRSLIEDAHQQMTRHDDRISVHVGVHGCWEHVSDVDPRPLSTVVLPDGVAEAVAADLRTFRGSKAWYVERGIPWRRGYLLHGPPGTGKTSLISGLAGAIGANLYVVNLAAAGMSDEALTRLMLNVPTDGVVLFEDIDAVVQGREVAKADRASVTFAGLLNALDGVASRPGTIVFLTTNHPEKLDPALVRPGRVDYQVAFGYATPGQIARIFLRFHPDATAPRATAFAAAYDGRDVTPAELQQVLLDHRDDPDAAIAAAGQRAARTLAAVA